MGFQNTNYDVTTAGHSSESTGNITRARHGASLTNSGERLGLRMLDRRRDVTEWAVLSVLRGAGLVRGVGEGKRGEGATRH